MGLFMKRRMNKTHYFLILAFVHLVTIGVYAQDYTKDVNKFIVTGGNGGIVPVACVPFGMMQIGPDTQPYGSGYHYNSQNIQGFSHLHKSGGGCADFLDIMFMPMPHSIGTNLPQTIKTGHIVSPLDHSKESASPGYYRIAVYGGETDVELTATRRCGIQRYTWHYQGDHNVLVDLEHGSVCACTIQPEHNVDTVYDAYIEVVDSHTIRGYRKSNGWAYHQQMFFYTTFSQPIDSAVMYIDNERWAGLYKAHGNNLKLMLTFAGNCNGMEVKTAISYVDMDGAKANLEAETTGIDFNTARTAAHRQWQNSLAQIEVKTTDAKRRTIFYTSLHNSLLYPMLSSDVDGRFRGPDDSIHNTGGFDYYGAVVGLWDTFRAQCPLMAMLHPNVMSDYVKTALSHYQACGQLPIWTLANMETYQMIGIHSMPMITNCYMNGIHNFDTHLALQAMIASADRDTCGWSMGYFVGMKNYKRYGYVPCDLEMEATARTLEYAYDDACIARFAKLIHADHSIIERFSRRAKNYTNVIDPTCNFARGRDSHANWRTPFHPLMSSHRNDDFCEGNAWQWTFFVPHDISGLAKIMGGKKQLENKLDSLFSLSVAVEGDNASGDISGLIGQYAHGNEPGHHTIYMYNRLGASAKTQQLVRRVIDTLYDDTPDGICGNEDTGQMSAWYVFSALGFYPMDPTSGHYEIGTPSFDEATIHLPSGKDFTVKARNLAHDKFLIKQMWLNGKRLRRTYLTFDEVLAGGELVMEMY